MSTNRTHQILNLWIFSQFAVWATDLKADNHVRYTTMITKTIRELTFTTTCIALTRAPKMLSAKCGSAAYEPWSRQLSVLDPIAVILPL